MSNRTGTNAGRTAQERREGTTSNTFTGAAIVVDSVNTAGVTLTGLAAAALTEGVLAWVNTVGAYFRLKDGSALTVDNITVATAAGRAGAQWIRLDIRNIAWEKVAGWGVNTTTGNDENVGSVASPLLTVTELARRLANAKIAQATTVDLSGDMAATDLPSFTFQVIGTATFTFRGTPTVIFTGVVTAFVQVAAAPEATAGNSLTDATVPVSFTASGMLADGILFRRTNGAAIEWWGAKDLGALTLRTSQPFNAATFANATPVALDTYTANTLPVVRQMRFSEQRPFTVFVQFVKGTSLSWFDPCVVLSRCWMITPVYGPVILLNVATSGSSSSWRGSPASNASSCAFYSGLFRHTGAGSFSFFRGNYACFARATTQGVSLICQIGFLYVNADLAAYDVTAGAGVLNCTDAAHVQFVAAGVQGQGSTNLATAGRYSSLVHSTTPMWVAASAAAANPIFVTGSVGSPFTVAQETAAAGVVNALGNGIFPTG